MKNFIFDPSLLDITVKYVFIFLFRLILRQSDCFRLLFTFKMRISQPVTMRCKYEWFAFLVKKTRRKIFCFFHKWNLTRTHFSIIENSPISFEMIVDSWTWHITSSKYLVLWRHPNWIVSFKILSFLIGWITCYYIWNI